MKEFKTLNSETRTDKKVERSNTISRRSKDIYNRFWQMLEKNATDREKSFGHDERFPFCVAVGEAPRFCPEYSRRCGYGIVW
ncbi:hypothetical protein CIHG_08685 [Coccidioides immitis H538.4]|uniref:Uncharacterized protein n=3 Tax=Coccidioides immitis TaxID=5501 RepID=A0A0J8QWW3_COCIT|nr:hypothetical protein CIRG_02628 [Coccidioides immitis RMSCC 2394]KMU77379.1 hypothetical protein CISG_06626 [Coccidioides immitis RMSCC 3703]KMU90725.1 hypothetical protein CIHG_08685 [Coccidioides immitis H538.4]